MEAHSLHGTRMLIATHGDNATCDVHDFPGNGSRIISLVNGLWSQECSTRDCRAIRSQCGSAGAPPSGQTFCSSWGVSPTLAVAVGSGLTANGPLNNSLPRATAVSAVRETSPFANFGTADTAVAHIFSRGTHFQQAANPTAQG